MGLPVSGRRIAAYAFGLLTSLAVLGLAAMPRQRVTPPLDPAASFVQRPTPESIDPAAAELGKRERRRKFFESQVIANLAATNEANRDAAKRAISRIQQNFDGYRRGVDPFVDDVLSFSSRFGILRRLPGGLYSRDERVSLYVAEKFAKYLFTEATLTSDLRDALMQFRDEVRANHRSMLVKTQADVAQSDLPPIPIEPYEVFFASIHSQLNEISEHQATTSVTEGVLALLVSEVGAKSVVMIASRLVSGLAASAASAAAASGGATAGAAAAGAASGSIVPGAGTIAGFVVGVGVGFAIDYWMNQRTAAALRDELIDYIDRLERDLIQGSPTGTASRSSDTRLGLANGMGAACDRLGESVRDRLFEIIVLETSP